ncbi:hypothetical protein K5X82_08735 [Halosquirtibacter xylanolyticus]|uniref:hypothetical protein n=1 Tax=Halosquirtibacter xylanolyticus TaxID=3374599 RepID=UPI00374872B6|nr:hypothetical protein K5X82_08735 [Prolixibacteraceae bacterium]
MKDHFGIAASSATIIAAIIGSVTTTATAVCAQVGQHQGKSGRGEPMTIELDEENKDFLMSEETKKVFEAIVYCMYEREKLYCSEISDEVAKLNTVSLFSRTLNNNKIKFTGEFVASGDNGTKKITPYGVANIQYEGGTFNISSFDNDTYIENNLSITDVADKKGLTSLRLLENESFDFLTRFEVNYESHKDVDWLSDDDVYVRGEYIKFVNEGYKLLLECSVAIDFDGDTVSLENSIQKKTAIKVGKPIPKPAWCGPLDPDD